MKTIIKIDSRSRPIPGVCRAKPMLSYAIWVLFSLLFLASMPVMAIGGDSDFDHFSTGFPLSGAHKRVDCENCHLRGVFQGTPKQCSACHNGRTAPGMNNKHIAAANTCDDCHTTFSWDTIAVDHTAVIGVCTSCHQIPLTNHVNTTSTCDNCHNTLSWNSTGFDHSDINQPCVSCHNNFNSGNGLNAIGMGPKHIPTAAPCDDCHTTRGFSPAKVDHTSLTAACVTCHNNIVVIGKNRNHFASNDVCDDCHNTVNWKAKIDHNNFPSGTQCVNCHNNSPIIGKSNNHIATNNLCDGCHNSRSFGNVIMNSSAHNNVLGTCQSCHEKTKSRNHWVTTGIGDCESCHRTTGWSSIKNYSHNNANYPGRHKSSVTCVRCHRLNGSGFDPATRWDSLQFKPDCAGCHARNFEAQGDHIGGRTGTVSQNRDCGASGCHRVSAGGFG